MTQQKPDTNGPVTYEATPDELRRLRRAKVFSTGMAALACRVAPRTVAKWVDAGRLKGYRLPGANDRRIPREHLLRFMKENHIPLTLLGGGEPVFRALLAGCPGPWGDLLEKALGADWTCQRAAGLFDAALVVSQHHPDAVILHASLGGVECAAASSRVRKALPGTLLIGVLADDAAEASPSAYDLTVRQSDDPALAARLLLERSAA